MQEKTCFHCGSTSRVWVRHDDKDFCCTGCSSVYEILKNGQLYTYYDIEKSPGIRTTSQQEEVYEYLDQEDIKKSVLDFYDGKMAKIRLYIPAIHCSSCIWLLENLSRLDEGILSSQVNFNKKQISVSFDESKIKLSRLMALLASIHYKAHIPDKNKKKEGQNRSLIMKLGIAGFAFGNVMLLSFPEYLSQDVSLNQGLVRTFSWIGFVLSLPVVFYSGSDYLITSWKNLKKKMVSIDLPIALGIVAIFLRSLYEIIMDIGPGYFDSLTGLIFFLLIGKWFQSRTYQALNFENDYTNYFPLGITKINPAGEKTIVPIKQLKAGDEILVKNGEIIPADSELESDETSVDYSFITGESIPVQKVKQELIYAGGRQIGKAVRLRVLKEVESSYLAQLWKEKIRKEEDSSAISSALNTVSRYFTIAILAIATVTAGVWAFIDPSKILFTFSSILIVACPCALALSVPFAFGHGRSILGKRGFFLKDSSVIESLSKADTVVFDKTGTLTDPTSFEVNFEATIETLDFSPVKSLLAESNHPLSRAVYQHLINEANHEVDSFEEIPGKGIKGIVDGKNIRLGSAVFLGIEIKEETDASRVYVEINDKVYGFFNVRNHYRLGIENLLKNMQVKYDVHLLSGDNHSERKVVGQWISNQENIHFKQTPVDKLEYIRQLKKQGKKVIMIGDGLNDAGALKESLCGISVADDVYQFTPSSDAIVGDKALLKLPSYLKFTAKVQVIVYISFVLSFLYNIIGLYFASTAQLSPIIAAILMPLSSITIVAFTSLSTILYSRFKRL